MSTKRDSQDVVLVSKRVGGLKLKSAERFGISPSRCHIGHVLLQALTDNPDGVNQLDVATEASETNGSLLSRSVRLASALQAAGLRVGDRVAVLGPNHLDLAVPYFASHYNGHSLCTIDGHTILSDLQYIFSNVQPKMVFCLRSQEPSVREALAGAGLSSQVVFFDGVEDSMEGFIKRHNGKEENFRPAELDQAEVTAWLLLTSGSTGKPKMAIIPYETVLNAILCWWAQFTEQIHRTFVMGTIQWMSAMLFYASGPIMGFQRVQVSVPLTPQLLIGIINKYKPNVTTWTPHMLQKFLHAAYHVCDLSSFKYIAIGGSSVEKPLLDKFREKCGAYLYLVYGMTELMVPVFEFNKDTPFGSSGKPFGKFQYRLVNDEGQQADVNESGELWIKGDEFFKGYLNNPEETDAVLTPDGWVKTGDVFYRDQDDYYYYVERKRLMIKHTGQWISPLQLEEVIKSHPGVADACVAGIPDTLDVEAPVAAVVRAPGGNVEAQDIFDLMKKELPPLKQLHGGLFFVEALPTTPSQKVHRAKVREMALLVQRTMPQN